MILRTFGLTFLLNILVKFSFLSNDMYCFLHVELYFLNRADKEVSKNWKWLLSVQCFFKVAICRMIALTIKH